MNHGTLWMCPREDGWFQWRRNLMLSYNTMQESFRSLERTDSKVKTQSLWLIWLLIENNDYLIFEKQCSLIS